MLRDGVAGPLVGVMSWEIRFTLQLCMLNWVAQAFVPPSRRNRRVLINFQPASETQTCAPQVRLPPAVYVHSKAGAVVRTLHCGGCLVVNHSSGTGSLISMEGGY